MKNHTRAQTTWYRIAATLNRYQRDAAHSLVTMIEREIAAAQYHILVEASKLVLVDQDRRDIARRLRERAEQLMASPSGAPRRR
jgi:hypothetical protein